MIRFEGFFLKMRNNQVIGWTLKSSGVLTLTPQKCGSDMGGKGNTVATLIQFNLKLSTVTNQGESPLPVSDLV